MKKCLQWQQEQRRISKNTQSGFSLIELCIVLALIALIAMFCMAQNNFLHRILVRLELDQLYTTCYMLQRSAIMLHQPQTLVFDISHHVYRYKQREYRLPGTVRFGTASGVKGPPSSPDNVVEVPVTFQENHITFTPEGIITTGSCIFN